MKKATHSNKIKTFAFFSLFRICMARHGVFNHQTKHDLHHQIRYEWNRIRNHTKKVEYTERGSFHPYLSARIFWSCLNIILAKIRMNFPHKCTRFSFEM